MRNPYLLLTPGPLSTSLGVRKALLQDWCTWDRDYQYITQDIRRRLLALGAMQEPQWTSVLLQGSGSFAVEAVLGTLVPPEQKLLVLSNGAYGERLAAMGRRLGLEVREETLPEDQAWTREILEPLLDQQTGPLTVAMVHCETTSGILNPLEELGPLVKDRGHLFFLDAMSSFGGMVAPWVDSGVDILVSSANKCIQGVPGFTFVLFKRELMEASRGRSPSLVLDLYDQWQTMEEQTGKWRYTSPTHTVRAFLQALRELEEEGGPAAREQRYRENQGLLVRGLEKLGFRALVSEDRQSPFITAFLYPESWKNFSFEGFYNGLKKRGFVIYPGKISQAPSFRIGTIGEVSPRDIRRLLRAVAELAELDQQI